MTCIGVSFVCLLRNVANEYHQNNTTNMTNILQTKMNYCIISNKHIFKMSVICISEMLIANHNSVTSLLIFYNLAVKSMVFGDAESIPGVEK